MDMAKLVAVLFSAEQKTDEVIGIGNVAGRSVKLVTASTTSGTGSEVTPIAVLTDTVAGLKKGVVSPHIVPDVAIVDPQLTRGMPSGLTAVTGMDAMTHCIEAYTNRFAHPIIDSLALDGVRPSSAEALKPRCRMETTSKPAPICPWAVCMAVCASARLIRRPCMPSPIRWAVPSRFPTACRIQYCCPSSCSSIYPHAWSAMLK